MQHAREPGRPTRAAADRMPTSGWWPTGLRRAATGTAVGLVLLCGVILSTSGGCAAYQVGHHSLYRPDVRTVYVPVFQSESFRRGLGERLTEAVVKEIELKTPYKVVHRPEADTVLTGVIASETKRVTAEDINDMPRDIETDLVVQVSWTDRRGQYLVEDARFNLSPVAFSVAQNADFIPEAGQSLATAHQEAIQRLAEQIVNQMESRW